VTIVQYVHRESRSTNWHTHIIALYR